MAMPYIAIPLSSLNEIRTELNANLRSLSEREGIKYHTRTFYIGPRVYNRRYKKFTTLKANARAAKLAIYRNNNLMTYV